MLGGRSSTKLGSAEGGAKREAGELWSASPDATGEAETWRGLIAVSAESSRQNQGLNGASESSPNDPGVTAPGTTAGPASSSVRCPECLAWTICSSGAPGGPALCEHPTPQYVVLAGGVLEKYVDCGAIAALKGDRA